MDNKQQLELHGISVYHLAKAQSVGLDFRLLLLLIADHGPVAVEIIQSILDDLKTVHRGQCYSEGAAS